VARAELALGELLPPLFVVADTSSSSSSSATSLRESVSAKVALVGGVLSALLLLLRVEVALPARSAAATAASASSIDRGHSIAALNRSRSARAARRRIRPRAAWEDEGSDSSDGERDESDEEGGAESE
jgi:hypothetical protein